MSKSTDDHEPIMVIRTITGKNQLTIPQKIASRLGIKRGHKIFCEVQEGQIILTPARLHAKEFAGSHAPGKRTAAPEPTTDPKELVSR